jgi:hypothetical protein
MSLIVARYAGGVWEPSAIESGSPVNPIYASLFWAMYPKIAGVSSNILPSSKVLAFSDIGLSSVNYFGDALVSVEVDTDAASGVTIHEAILNGDLVDIAGLVSVFVFFEYGKVSGVYTNTTTPEEMWAIGLFHSDVASLDADTTYYFRAVADDGTTLYYGVELSFDTLEEPVLDVETDPATNILAHGATLNGDLVDIGVSTLVDVYFEYGVSSGVYVYTTPIQVMITIGIFHEHVSYLQNNTTYYFRAVADNGTVIVYGIEREFTTISPEGLVITKTLGLPNRVITLKVNLRV